MVVLARRPVLGARVDLALFTAKYSLVLINSPIGLTVSSDLTVALNEFKLPGRFTGTTALSALPI